MVQIRSCGDGETCGLYPRPAALVDGVSPASSRADVAALFGTPERSRPTFDRYEVESGYLHVEFDSNSRVAKLSVLLEPV